MRQGTGGAETGDREGGAEAGYRETGDRRVVLRQGRDG